MLIKQNKLEKLEALRGFAALYVVMHHLTLNKKNILSFIFAEGQAAVMLFFVISGFVIYYSSYNAKIKGAFNFKSYFVKRFRRIYPVFIASLVLIYLAASYASHSWLPLADKELAGNLLNLQDLKRIPGNWVKPYYSNTPIWSLSYEWWFYMLFFPIFKWVKQEKQKYLVWGISVLGFVTFYIINNKISITLEYFVLWWSGVEIARSYVQNKKISAETLKYLFLSYGSMIALLILGVVVYKGKMKVDDHPIIELRHFTYAAVIITIGYFWQKLRFVGFRYILKPFLFFAPVSYGIYVFHSALMYKYDVFPFKYSILNIIAGFICVLLLAYFFEVYLQEKINKFTNRYFLNNEINDSTAAIVLDGSKLQP